MRLMIFAILAVCVASCASGTELAAETPVRTGIPADTASATPAEAENVSHPLPLEVSWQIQYSGEMDYSMDVKMYNVDLFDTQTETISALKERGIFVMCYFSAGSHEDWRPDASDFPPDTLGNPMEGWAGETWLDIHQISDLRPVMEKRMDMALAKGCDGLDPDNVNGFENNTGFPLTYDDQLAFNIFLSNAAHERGMAIGLKNDLSQVGDLVSYFDWILNEECFSYSECDQLLPFIEAGKPVFVIEYELSPQEFCEQANRMNFNALHKNWELDAYRVACR